MSTRTKPKPDREEAFRPGALEWSIALAIAALTLFALPPLWRRLEPFEPGGDYRIPHLAGEDYWLQARWIKRATGEAGRIPILGDSVVWGEYVARSQTLSAWLDRLSDSARFANGGVPGLHPLALEGFVRDHLPSVASRRILLHLDLLWGSSPARDLSSEKETPVQHPRLLSQILGSPPAYRAKLSARLGIVADRWLPFRSWRRHILITRYGSRDLVPWTIEHPYEPPFAPLGRPLPPPAAGRRHNGRSWRERRIPRRDLEWVEPERSLQYAAFRRTVERLRARGARPFVLVGPFNVHLLAPGGRKLHAAWRKSVAAWLRRERLPAYLPSALPSGEYADASHPLASGYERLARGLLSSPLYRSWARR